ncbi:MAG: dicarboxylate/amino acid:cation symporter [Pseudomonadota bacterium]|nr:dicarboxylate/amino acid:cation symporter [Pseudomonadota bacterium]
MPLDAPAPLPRALRCAPPLYVAILLAMLLGLVVGPMVGKDGAVFGEMGKLVIGLIKAVATPLLFFAVVNAILKTEIQARSGVKMLVIALVNASIALAIGLSLSNLLQPGLHLGAAMPTDPKAAEAYAGKSVDFLKTFIGYVPTNFVTPFAENVIITVVVLALLIGFGLRAARREQAAAGADGFRVIEDVVATLLRTLELILGWVIKLIPFAVFGVVVKTIGEHGYAPLKGLAAYVGVGLLGLFLHAAVTYQAWLVLRVGMPLRRFWREAREPIVYAMGTNSSLATLPVTLRALDRLGVSRGASALGACVGTNLNNDGIVLYEGMAVLFVAQASGIQLDLGQQVLAAVTCMVAAMGVAGVPEAGFISLALVVNTVGLPIEVLPLLLTVDWVIARARSVVNVLSDMVLSIVLDEPALHDDPAVDLVGQRAPGSG